MHQRRMTLNQVAIMAKKNFLFDDGKKSNSKQVEVRLIGSNVVQAADLKK